MIKSIDYAHHLLIEMRRPTDAPPVPAMPARYVCSLPDVSRLIKSKPPIRYDDGRLSIAPHLAAATIELAIADCAKRGIVVSASDVISIYHEQVNAPRDRWELPDLFIDNWGIYPAQVTRRSPFAWKLPKATWQAITESVGIEVFCETQLSQFERVVSVAQLAKRFGVAFIPLVAFKIPQPVACPETCAAIRNADRAYRLLTEFAPTRIEI